jgi:uncharacterized protein YodC (DUF2158 family)
MTLNEAKKVQVGSTLRTKDGGHRLTVTEVRHGAEVGGRKWIKFVGIVNNRPGTAVFLHTEVRKLVAG